MKDPLRLRKSFKAGTKCQRRRKKGPLCGVGPLGRTVGLK